MNYPADDRFDEEVKPFGKRCNVVLVDYTTAVFAGRTADAADRPRFKCELAFERICSGALGEMTPLIL